MRINGTRNEVNSSQGAFVEMDSQLVWYKSTCVCHRTMYPIPGTPIDVADGIEEVAPLKGKLLRAQGTMAACPANDCLKSHGGRGLRKGMEIYGW